MKPEKMTTEALVGIRQRMESGETMTAGEQRAVLAFIAALEAEQTTLDEHYRTACADASRFEGMCRSAESDLSAIRQRAGNTEARRRVAETCAIMGGPSSTWDGAVHADVVAGGHERMLHDVADGLASYILGEGAEAHEHRYRADGSCECGALVQESPASAPTTAEAFATVRTLVTGVPRGTEVSSVEGERLLSLLERRMGALARELGLVASDLYHERFATAESRVKDLIALTDAPPVFTLEEVERLAAEHCSAGDASRLVRALAALRSTGGGQ
jgi:hypothetical protein